MENSRYKQFINFRLRALWSSRRKSSTVPLRPARGVNHPCVGRGGEREREGGTGWGRGGERGREVYVIISCSNLLLCLMPNLQIELYHRYVGLGTKRSIYYRVFTVGRFRLTSLL